MWLLIITIVFYGDPAAGQVHSTVSNAPFRSETSCKAAAGRYQTDMAPIVTKVRQHIKDQKKVGEAQQLVDFEVQTLCVAQ